MTRSPLRHLTAPDEVARIAAKVREIEPVCSCGWEVPVVWATVDDTKPPREVILDCPICHCPVRAKVKSPK